MTVDGALDWILDLLIIYTHDSELQAITAPPLISTIHKSPQQPLNLFRPARVFTSRFLATASNGGDFSPSRPQVLSEGGSLPTTSFPYTTDLVAPFVILITPLHGSSRKHRFQRYLYCCMHIICRGNVFN
jgi:hypothetical protein